MSVSLVALLYFKFVAIAQGRWLQNGRKKKKTVLSLICLSASYLDSSALHLLFLEGVGETFLISILAAVIMPC